METWITKSLTPTLDFTDPDLWVPSINLAFIESRGLFRNEQTLSKDLIALFDVATHNLQIYPEEEIKNPKLVNVLLPVLEIEAQLRIGPRPYMELPRCKILAFPKISHIEYVDYVNAFNLEFSYQYNVLMNYDASSPTVGQIAQFETAFTSGITYVKTSTVTQTTHGITEVKSTYTITKSEEEISTPQLVKGETDVSLSSMTNQPRITGIHRRKSTFLSRLHWFKRK